MAKARRERGTGYKRQRGNKWVIGYRIFGKQKWESFATELEADARLVEVRTIIQEQRELELMGMPFKTFAEEWLANVPVSDGQYRAIEATLRNHLIPAFGSDFLHQIDEAAMNQYIKHKLAGNIPVEGGKKRLSERTVNSHKALMRRVFDDGVKKGFLKSNPLAEVEGAPVKEPPPQAIEQEHLDKVFAQLPSHARMFFTFLLETGCRSGEAFGITWQDYTESERRLHFRRGLSRVGRTGGKVESGTPKTPTAYRNMKVSENFHNRLMAHKAATANIANPMNLIFPNQAGGFHSSTNLGGRVWKRAVEKAGLSGLKPHQLRHTFGSRHIHRGTSIKLISYWLGHKDVRTTLDIYGHILKEAHEQEADTLGSDDTPASE